MEAQANNLFTAAQIAGALGIKRQAAQRTLSDIAPSGKVPVRGRPANAWMVAALPAHSQELLASRAQNSGFRGPEQLLRAPGPKDAIKPTISLAAQTEFRELLTVVAMFKNATQPAEDEKEYLWLRTFELFEEKLAAGKPRKKLKSALVRFLVRNAPFMAASGDALRVTFNRKYRRWAESDRTALALRDGRKEKSGFHRAPELKAEDRDALIAHAVLNCDGRVSQAWRELAGKSALSEELLAYYLSNPASKSYCPTRIREAVKYEVGMMDDIHHGPRQDKLNGAHINRDWSGVAAMDWLCGDGLAMRR